MTCHVPIDAWIPAEYRNATNLVVGIEFDGDQFASWTVMAKPRTAHIAAVIEYIMDALEDVAAQVGTSIAGLTMAMIEDVVAVTGPQAMTRAILESVSVELGVEVGGENVSGLREPVLLHDVLVLPNAAFAAMQGGFPEDQGLYLVEHHYAGSWKNDRGGERVAGSPIELDHFDEVNAKVDGPRDGIKAEVRGDGGS